MFSKILGKNKESSSEDENALLVEQISKMNLTEMRSYVNNKAHNFEITEDGLREVMKKLTIVDEKTSKTYLQIDDMDSKKKKGFELVLMVSKSKYISIEVVELMQEFVVMYKDLVSKYDTDNKEIYSSRFSDAIKVSLENVNKQSELRRKAEVLGE